MRKIACLYVALVAALPAAAAEPRRTPLASEFIYAEAPYPQAHASTIVELKDGRIAAAWFGGTRERDPDVEIWFAIRSDAGWSKPVSVASGVQAGGPRMPTWNPVLFQSPAGPLHLFYKVGPHPRGWWGMEIISVDGGRTWSAPRRLPAGIVGPVKNKPVILADGSWLSPTSDERGDPADAAWSLRFERSLDRGASWTSSAAVPDPLGLQAIQPSVLALPDGAVEAVARTRSGVIAATFSRDAGKSWSPLMPIDLPNPNSGTDAVTLRDGRQLIVYNHSAHDPASPNKGKRYPLNVALSRDGVRWTKVLTLESEPVPSGYAYPAVIQTRDGLVHVTYTHNRRRIRHVVLNPQQLTAEESAP